MLLAGNLPWAALGARNLAVGTAVPWAILPTTLYLWAYWRFISGAWGAQAGGATRRANLRANRLPSGVWLPALAAGLVGFAALLAFLFVAARIVQLPTSVPIVTPPDMPVLTVVLLLTMQSIVAGVTEEAAFRGYMQSMVERHYGLVVAILVATSSCSLGGGRPAGPNGRSRPPRRHSCGIAALTRPSSWRRSFLSCSPSQLHEHTDGCATCG